MKFIIESMPFNKADNSIGFYVLFILCRTVYELPLPRTLMCNFYTTVIYVACRCHSPCSKSTRRCMCTEDDIVKYLYLAPVEKGGGEGGDTLPPRLAFKGTES
jgi:hypothetical protein